jgi:hypothetical protein
MVPALLHPPARSILLPDRRKISRLKQRKTMYTTIQQGTTRAHRDPTTPVIEANVLSARSTMTSTNSNRDKSSPHPSPARKDGSERACALQGSDVREPSRGRAWICSEAQCCKVSRHCGLMVVPAVTRPDLLWLRSRSSPSSATKKARVNQHDTAAAPFRAPLNLAWRYSAKIRVG